MNIPESLEKVLNSCPGTPYITGGAVRDWFLSESTVTPKDFDVEVYGVEGEELAKYLSRFGKVDEVGKSFGVYKLTLPDLENPVDFSLPRVEVSTGEGHKDFKVIVDPHASLEDAAIRRDLTINTLMWNPSKKELVDIYGGSTDLRDGVLRAVSDRFMEDPLRPLRVFQFAGRFGFTVTDYTADLCLKLLPHYKSLPVERVWEEWKKWAEKSTRPSAGLRALKQIGWIEAYPELFNLIGCKQDPGHHPEGDVFEHTCHTVDAAYELVLSDNLIGEDRSRIMFAALCHDFGKPATTRMHPEKKRIVSYGHDRKGAPLALKFMESIGAPIQLRQEVASLVAEHMVHVCANKPLSETAVRKCAERLKPAKIKDLMLVIEADHYGRPPLPRNSPCPELWTIAEKLNCLEGITPPLVQGRDLLELGVAPGPAVGQLLKAVRNRQLKGKFTSKEQAVAWLKNRV